MLRNKATVSPKNDKAKHLYATYLNNKALVYIEHKTAKRRFFSAIDNPDYWFWVDVPEDANWNYQEITS